MCQQHLKHKDIFINLVKKFTKANEHTIELGKVERVTGSCRILRRLIARVYKSLKQM